MHRDLAARNVLIADNDTAKLSDFGLARDIKEGEEYVKSNRVKCQISILINKYSLFIHFV